jgi:sulfur-oxidizing protein SoxY
MATTQRIVAVAKMLDGSCWTHTVEVVVTLAACLDD